MKKRCVYSYPDGKRCIIDNLSEDRDMCTDHVLLTQIKKDKKKNDAKRDWSKRPSRAKPKVEIVRKSWVYIDDSVYDHTAPWKCSLDKCGICAEKPTYEEYMRSKM